VKTFPILRGPQLDRYRRSPDSSVSLTTEKARNPERFLWAAAACPNKEFYPIWVGSDQPGSTVPGKCGKAIFPQRNLLFLKEGIFPTKRLCSVGGKD